MFDWEKELAAMQPCAFNDMRDKTISHVSWLHSYDAVRYHMTDNSLFVVRANKLTSEVDCYKRREE